jgi:hypothetical protein
MAECVNILYEKGDLNLVDINRELDPLFVHVGFMARDRAERVYNAMPRFMILRPGHLGGQVRFKLFFGAEHEGNFLGGRFRVAFGEFRSVVYDANIEKLGYGDYLIDEEAEPRYRLIASGMQEVSFDVPPGVEEIFFDAQVPVGALYFIRDLYFSASARKSPSVGSEEPSETVVERGPARGTVSASVPEQAGKAAKLAKQVSPAAQSLDDESTKKLRQLSERLSEALKELGSHLDRAESKKSGHPKFLEALRSDEKRLERLDRDLRGLLENPGGYEW